MLKDSGVLYEDPHVQVFSSFFSNIIEAWVVFIMIYTVYVYSLHREFSTIDLLS